MKVGDKLYCYNELGLDSSFVCGKWYIIEKLCYGFMKGIPVPYHGEIVNIIQIDIRDDNNWVTMFNARSARTINLLYFKDYFYTEGEMRMQKLEKINNG